MGIDELFDKLKNDYKFAITKFTKDCYKDCRCWIFERKVERDTETHKVTLEDHRWEKEAPNYKDVLDGGLDIGDWLILSELIDSDTDWYGSKISKPYPLTLGEMSAFIGIIKELEKEYENN